MSYKLWLQYFLAHDVNLCLKVLIPAHCVIEFDLFICEHVHDMSADDLLLMKVLLARYHLLNLDLLLIELREHLLALILEYQVPSTNYKSYHRHLLSLML